MATHFILDGSNLAHDGSSPTPSFARLMEAAESLTHENEQAKITICVDASLMTALSQSERSAYVKADRARELFVAPAGTVGGGDAWLVAVAKKALQTTDTVVLVTNDSLAELQADNSWLFDEGRLLGGHKVDGVGWVWITRYPVDKRKRPTTVKHSTKTVHRLEIEPEQPTNTGGPDQTDSSHGTMAEEGAEVGGGALNLDLGKLPGSESVVEAEVTRIVDYGIFVTTDQEHSGRIQRRDFAPEDVNRMPAEVFRLGERIFAAVLRVNARGQLSLSIKDALTAPSDEDVQEYLEKYGLPNAYDEEGQYVYPSGYDPESESWLEGFEDQKREWEEEYAKAYAKWQRHVQWLADRVHLSGDSDASYGDGPVGQIDEQTWGSPGITGGPTSGSSNDS